MAEAPQDSRKSAEEALQASKDILKTEGDINGQLKERVKNLQKVIKAHDDIIGKIKASEELGKDLKELDLDIYKNLRQRVQMENALGRIQMEGQQRGIDLLAIVQEKRESIKASQLQEKLVQAQLNEKKQELLEIENKDLELKELINTKKQELNKSLFEESRI